MNDMATVKLILKHNKKEPSGLVPLYIRIIHHRKSKHISLGIKVNPIKDWDAKRQRVKKSFSNANRVNNYIANKLAEAEAYALDLSTKSKSITARRIKEEIIGRPPESYILFAEKLIKRLKQSDQERTAIRYQCVINKLERFLGSKDFTFDDFTVPFLHDYEAHLKSIGNHVNTVHTNLKTLRAILYIAIREDRFPQEKNPFFRFKLKTAPTKKERLTMEEIDKLAALELDKDSILFHCRNVFLFSFYCAGIRIGDIFQLKWQNVAANLDYQMGKTQQFRRLKIVRQAQAILDLYRTDNINPEGFVFPFLCDDTDYSDAEFLMRRLASKTTTINCYLKKLAVRAGINKTITSHIARHSFADVARQRGMKLYDISKALGHSSLSITETYLSNFDDRSLDSAMDELFG